MDKQIFQFFHVILFFLERKMSGASKSTGDSVQGQKLQLSVGIVSPTGNSFGFTLDIYFLKPSKFQIQQLLYSIKNCENLPGMMARPFFPSAWEAEAGVSGLQSKFQDSQGYMEKLCLEKQSKTKPKRGKFRFSTFRYTYFFM